MSSAPCFFASNASFVAHTWQLWLFLGSIVKCRVSEQVLMLLRVRYESDFVHYSPCMFGGTNFSQIGKPLSQAKMAQLQFLFLVRLGNKEALISGIDCWNVMARRSSRVWEQTMRFFLAYMTKPPRHELVGSFSLYSGKNFSWSMVTTQGGSRPSSAFTWSRIELLYWSTASSMID